MLLIAAENPLRDVFVGSQANFLNVLGNLDRVMEIWIPPSQYVNRPSNPREESNLYHAGYMLHERGTNKGWIRSQNMYVKATKHPAAFSNLIRYWYICIRSTRKF